MTKAVSLGSGEPPGRHTDIVSAARPLSPSYDPLTDRLCAAGELHVHDRAADKCLLSIHCGPSTQLARSPMLADFGPAVLECATAASRSSLLELSTASRDRLCRKSPPWRQSRKIDPVTCPCGATTVRDGSRGGHGFWRDEGTPTFFQHNRPCVDLVEQVVRSACGILPPSPADLTANELPMRRALWPPCLWRGPRPR